MLKDLATSLRPALVMGLLFALLLGIGYPLAMTGLGQLFFPRQANGSLVIDHGRAIGSSVVGQAFVSDRYFNSRPSAAGKGYDGIASSGSNLGPASQALVDRVKADVTRLDAKTGETIPADIVTASGSGLDPDISPENARFQISRIAKARALPEARLQRLVDEATAHPILGFLGEARVNLLDINRRLDAIGAKATG
ncbi:MAG: potassium-transporting ATPase subunit KdpC [Sphingobium sp.]